MDNEQSQKRNDPTGSLDRGNGIAGTAYQADRDYSVNLHCDVCLRMIFDEEYAKRRRALDELARISQELGLYD